MPWFAGALVWPLKVTVKIGAPLACVGMGVFEGSSAAT
jgi:hypothetical protein